MLISPPYSHSGPQNLPLNRPPPPCKIYPGTLEQNQIQPECRKQLRWFEPLRWKRQPTFPWFEIIVPFPVAFDTIKGLNHELEERLSLLSGCRMLKTKTCCTHLILTRSNARKVKHESSSQVYQISIAILSSGGKWSFTRDMIENMLVIVIHKFQSRTSPALLHLWWRLDRAVQGFPVLATSYLHYSIIRDLTYNSIIILSLMLTIAILNLVQRMVRGRGFKQGIIDDRC
mgnify:CR=1 FL=1